MQEQVILKFMDQFMKLNLGKVFVKIYLKSSVFFVNSAISSIFGSLLVVKILNTHGFFSVLSADLIRTIFIISGCTQLFLLLTNLCLVLKIFS